MKFMLSLLALGYVALAIPTPSLPLHPGGIGGFFKGPNSETIIKGPDGSVITAAAEGGEVKTELEPIVVAQPAIVPEAAVAITPGSVELKSTVIAAAAPAPVIEAVPVPPAVVPSEQSSDLIGPSGRIATQGSQSVIAGPASTTIAGPPVIAETIVRGPPIVATPTLGAAPPVVAVTPAPAVAVTPIPVAVTSGEISPISVTAAPVVTVTASPLPLLPTAELNGRGIISNGVISAVSSQAVATASTSPHSSVASASAIDGASASASVGPNKATAVVGSGGVTTITATSLPGVPTYGPPPVTVTPLPIIPSTLNPNRIDGIQGVNTPGLVTINDRIDLTQSIPDQIAIDNRQLHLNPTLIPSVNIIPPEIPVTPRIPISRIRPTPGTLLTTPGLGSTNIIREESDVTGVTPSTLQIVTPQATLTPQQAIGLQNQQALLNNQIVSTQALGQANILRNEAGLSVTANPLLINPQVSLVPDSTLVLQNQQNLLNNQLRALGTRVVTNDPRLDGGSRTLFAPNVNSTPQSILNSELAKSGIDASQLQLTNVPLSSVVGLPAGNLKGGSINGGLAGEAWGRYGRGVEKGKNAVKDDKEKN